MGNPKFVNIATNGAQALYSVSLSYSGESLCAITGADGIRFTVSCSGGRLRSVTDPHGRSVTYSYDSQGRLTRVSGETCGTMNYTYDGKVDNDAQWYKPFNLCYFRPC